MTRLPRYLILVGTAVTVFAVYKIWQASNPLPEHSPFPPSLSMNRLKMDTDAVVNGRVNWITLPETWRP